MEAVKNRLTSFGWDARPFVVDPDTNLVADARNGDLDQATRGREADRIVDDCVDCPSETVRLAHDRRGVLSGPGEGESRIAGFAPVLPAVNDLLDQGAKIDAFELRPGQLRVRPSRLADVTDQPVEPGDVLAHDLAQL